MRAAECDLIVMSIFLSSQIARCLARKLTSIPVPDAVVSGCVILNPYAVEVRHPDDAWLPILGDALEARKAAESVRAWIQEIIPS